MLRRQRKNRLAMTEEEILDGKNSDIGQHPWHEKKRINKHIKIMRANFLRTYVQTGGDVKVAKEAAGYAKGSCVHLRDDLKKDIALANKKLWEKFGEYADEAFQVQLEIMRNPKCSFKVKLDVTNSILDRAGFKPAERKEVVGAVGISSGGREIGEFAERARRMMALKTLSEADSDIADAEIVLDNPSLDSLEEETTDK